MVTSEIHVSIPFLFVEILARKFSLVVFIFAKNLAMKVLVLPVKNLLKSSADVNSLVESFNVLN